MAQSFLIVLSNRVTDSATENKPPAKQPDDSPEENLRDIFQRLPSPVRVKRWGKSPPPRWQHRGHGKPREVQDQIGGQSWPGSLSTARKRGGSFPNGACLPKAGKPPGLTNPRVGRWIPAARPGLEE